MSNIEPPWLAIESTESRPREPGVGALEVEEAMRLARRGVIQGLLRRVGVVGLVERVGG